MATIINTKDLKKALVNLMQEKVTLNSIQDLKDTINYDKKAKFENIDYLLANIDNSVEGIYCKDLILKIKTFINNTNKESILYSSVKAESTIEQMLNVQIGGINIENMSYKITEKSGEKIKNLNELEYSSYIYYDEGKNEIVQVNCT